MLDDTSPAARDRRQAMLRTVEKMLKKQIANGFFAMLKKPFAFLNMLKKPFAFLNMLKEPIAFFALAK